MKTCFANKASACAGVIADTDALKKKYDMRLRRKCGGSNGGGSGGEGGGGENRSPIGYKELT